MFKIFRAINRLIQEVVWALRHPRITVSSLREVRAHHDYPNSGVASIPMGLALMGAGVSTFERILKISGRTAPPTYPLSWLKEKLSKSAEQAQVNFRVLFDEFGSDKGTWHGYSYLYGLILSAMPSREIKILEIGVGSRRKSIPSNMGKSGHPGASLRAFTHYSNLVTCVGLDVDPDIHIREERISTHFFDQLNPESWTQLPGHVRESQFDLIIDDGLHSPIANLNSALACLGMLGDEGFLVIEDVPDRALPVWDLISVAGVPDFELRKIRFHLANCIVLARPAALRKVGL